MQSRNPSGELQFALERPIQHRRQQRIQLGGGLGLKPLQRVHFRLQVIEVGDYAALL